MMQNKYRDKNGFHHILLCIIKACYLILCIFMISSKCLMILLLVLSGIVSVTGRQSKAKVQVFDQ
jgi:hypothetical protein